MRQDLTGMKIGRLTVLNKLDERDKNGNIVWKCVCDCQKDTENYTYVTTGNLNLAMKTTSKGTRSCGCLKSANMRELGRRNSRSNKYDLSSQTYGIGYTHDGYCFVFDKEDYDLIRKYCWHRHDDGYLRTRYDVFRDEEGKLHNRYIMMHQLILINDKKELLEIDHINGKPFDNRKCNLRLGTHSANMINRVMLASNTSGHKGVCYSNRECKWKAYINYDKNRIHLGTFLTYEEAVCAREKAEKMYHNDFRREEKRCYTD